MQLSDLSLELRPRRPWEAIDLGVALLRAHWKPVLIAWLVATLPVALLIYGLVPRHSWWAWVALWWLKPLFDRVPLYVLSRGVFGASTTLRDLAYELPSILRNGVFAQLTYARFDPARSFNMPIYLLEDLGGATARERGRLLRKRGTAHAAWLTWTCFHFEFLLAIALAALVVMVIPQPEASPPSGEALLSMFVSRPELMPVWLYYLTALLNYIAMTVIELMYVACGFTLYLNRRVLLEGWDIEVALRALAARAAARAKPWAAAAVLMLALGLSTADSVSYAAASPKQEIAEVLKAPEFERWEQVTYWKYVGPTWEDKDKEKPKPQSSPASSVVAEIVRVLMWLLAAALLVVLLRIISRWRGGARQAPRTQPDSTIMREGDIDTSARIPRDVPAAVRALLAAGRVREALALMYRAAAHKLGAQDSDTESACLSLVTEAEPQRKQYVAQLVRAWQRAAYADQLDTDNAQTLLQGWQQHFGAKP